MAPDIVWAKVPGWNWWPAVVLPGPDNARETRGTRSTKKDDENERVVLFLVDKTVARVPRELPAFAQHYTRFLSATYSNKKLFQAVEEARALVCEEPAADTAHDVAKQQQLIAYPPPVREDFKKTSRQLLHWLKTAALDPLAPSNRLSDQCNKRVLHAVHDNRLVSEDAKRFVLPPEVVIADRPTAPAPAPARPSSRSGITFADAASEQLPAKRQRKPQAWLQMYGDLPESVVRNSSNAPPAGPTATPAAKAAPAPAAAAVAGSIAAPTGQKASQFARSSSVSAPKPGGHLTKLRQQQQQLVRQHSMVQKGAQQVNAAVADSSTAPGRGRKRARSVVLDDYVVVEGSDSELDSEESSMVLDDGCCDDDDVQQQQHTPHARGAGTALVRMQSPTAYPGQSAQHNSKKRCLMDLLDGSKSVAAATSTAAAAAAAVAAAFGGVESATARPGSLGSDSRVGRKQQQRQQQQQNLQEESGSDSDADAHGYCSQPVETDMSDEEGSSRWRQRNQPLAMRRSIVRGPQQPRRCLADDVMRCDSPQLLRLQAGTHHLCPPGLHPARAQAGDANYGCCCCCCGRHQQGCNAVPRQPCQTAAGWLSNHDVLNPEAVGAVFEPYAAAPVDLSLPACCLQHPVSSPTRRAPGQHQQQMQMQQQITDADGEMSLVEVEALADRGLLSSMAQEDGLTSPSSILTAAGAPLRPTATRPTAVAANRACSIPLLRPPSPLLGAAPVVAVGAELLPGLEDDLQHAAVMFGSSSDDENSLQQQQRKDSNTGQQDPATVAGEGYMSDGASAAAAVAEETYVAPLELQPALTDADMTAAGGMHPESPSTGSHAGLHFAPGWDLEVITSGPQDSELQAEIAAATARSAAAAASARASVEIPAVLGYKRAALHRSASSTGDDVRRLALARSCSSTKTPDVHSQLQDCKEQLQASTEIVRQLKQQLETKDEQIAALNSQTSAQAKQLQQQAGELMALRALLGKQQKQAGAATAASTATGAEPSSRPSCPSKAGQQAAEATQDPATGPDKGASADAEPTSPQPTRRSNRLSAATKAAAKDSVTSVIPTAAPSGTAEQQDVLQMQYADKDDEITDLRQQLTDTRLMVTALEEQLQVVRRQTSTLAQQQQAEVVQLRGWLQAAEIDAALMRNENELLKKVLPGAVVSKVSATARKPASKAAGGKAAAGPASAVAGKAEGGQSGSTKRSSGGRGINAMKALLASQKAAGVTASKGTVVSPATGANSGAAAEVKGVLLKQATAAGQPVAAAPVASPAAAAVTSKAADVLNRQPRMQMPLQAITLPAAAAANPQTLAAALAALREAAAANTNTCVSNTNSAASAQTKPGSTSAASTAAGAARLPASAPQTAGPAFISLAAPGNSSNVSAPMVLLRPTGNLPLATMLQLNAALSHLAANAGKQASAAGPTGGVKQTQAQPAVVAPAAAAGASAGPAAGQAQGGGRQAASGGSTPSPTYGLVLNAPGCTTVKGVSGMSKATAAALAQFAVTAPAAGAATAAGVKAGGPSAASASQPKAGTKPGLNLNDP